MYSWKIIHPLVNLRGDVHGTVNPHWLRNMNGWNRNNTQNKIDAGLEGFFPALLMVPHCLKQKYSLILTTIFKTKASLVPRYQGCLYQTFSTSVHVRLLQICHRVCASIPHYGARIPKRFTLREYSRLHTLGLARGVRIIFSFQQQLETVPGTASGKTAEKMDRGKKTGIHQMDWVELL